MTYYKIIDGDYIIAIGIDTGGKEIDKTEYEKIKDVINTHYATKSDKLYRLRINLTWEEIDPPKPEKDGE